MIEPTNGFGGVGKSQIKNNYKYCFRKTHQNSVDWWTFLLVYFATLFFTISSSLSSSEQ